MLVIKSNYNETRTFPWNDAREVIVDGTDRQLSWKKCKINRKLLGFWCQQNALSSGNIWFNPQKIARSGSRCSLCLCLSNEGARSTNLYPHQPMLWCNDGSHGIVQRLQISESSLATSVMSWLCKHLPTSRWSNKNCTQSMLSLTKLNFPGKKRTSCPVTKKAAMITLISAALIGTILSLHHSLGWWGYRFVDLAPSLLERRQWEHLLPFWRKQAIHRTTSTYNIT